MKAESQDRWLGLDQPRKSLTRKAIASHRNPRLPLPSPEDHGLRSRDRQFPRKQLALAAATAHIGQDRSKGKINVLSTQTQT